MAHDQTDRTDRRTFLQAGALATASAVSLVPGLGAQDLVAKSAVLPTRKLGKTGIDVSILEAGAVRSDERVLRIAYANGIRIFDTARLYGTEPNFKKWFAQDSKVRKDIVIVTKDMPRRPSDMLQMVDKRLAALGTDYIDLFFIHGLGDQRSLNDSINMVTSQEFKETADAIRKSGKAKFIGFSTPPQGPRRHHRGGGQGGNRRRDHAPVPALARQGFTAQQGARCLLEERDRPDLDEADRRQRIRR